MGLNICLRSGDSQARLSHCRAEGTMTSRITQTLDVISPNECCVVAELTRSSEGVSKCKKKHTRKHTQIPFYLRPRDGTSRYACSSLRLLCTHCCANYIRHVIFYKLYSTLPPCFNHSSLNFNLKLKTGWCDSQRHK